MANLDQIKVRKTNTIYDLEDSTARDSISSINDKIPSGASSSDKLVKSSDLGTAAGKDSTSTITAGSTDLAEAFIGIEIGKTYKVKVVCKLDTITAYIDGKKIVEYTDPDPYIQGMPGFRSTMGRAIITNTSVKGV